MSGTGVRENLTAERSVMRGYGPPQYLKSIQYWPCTSFLNDVTVGKMKNHGHCGVTAKFPLPQGSANPASSLSFLAELPEKGLSSPRVWIRVWGVGIGVWGLGIRVQGSRIRV